MKRFFFLMLLFGASWSLFGSEEATVRVVRDGNQVPAIAESNITDRSINLLRSCSVNSTSYAVKSNTWVHLLGSESFVHLVFKKPTQLSVMMTAGTGLPRHPEPTTINEILIPLPKGEWPQHLFAKSGTEVLAFTKYSPLALRHLAFEPDIQLAQVLPYSELKQLPDK